MYYYIYEWYTLNPSKRRLAALYVTKIIERRHCILWVFIIPASVYEFTLSLYLDFIWVLSQYTTTVIRNSIGNRPNIFLKCRGNTVIILCILYRVASYSMFWAFTSIIYIVAMFTRHIFYTWNIYEGGIFRWTL